MFSVKPKAFRKALRKLIRNEDGAAMVEFAICAPILFLLFFVTLEFAYMKVRQVALDRVTDETFRELRLGLIANANHARVKSAICAKPIAELLLNDCDDNLLLEVRNVPKTTWSNTMSEDPLCLDTTPAEDYEPPIVFTAGGENQLMVARACLIQEPLFPPFEWVLFIRRYDEAGNFALLSKSAFVNEPS